MLLRPTHFRVIMPVAITGRDSTAPAVSRHARPHRQAEHNVRGARRRSILCEPHMPSLDVRFFAAATSNPFHSLLSPTTRRSILLIRSERSASAALTASIVCCSVLAFDPSNTIPPSTAAIDPIAAT